MNTKPFLGKLGVLITKEDMDGETMFIASSDEFPNLYAYEPTYREAWEILVDAICTLREMSEEQRGGSGEI